jgi:hypothetical protein
VFEGLVGSSYRGDIGVDDIKLLQGPCTTAGTLLTAPNQVISYTCSKI